MSVLDKIADKFHKWLDRDSTREFLTLMLFVYIALDAIVLAWFFLTPVFASSPNHLLFGLSMSGYNYGYLTTNCHQMPQRSLRFNGFYMPFCSRDTGVYLGCLIGAILPLSRLNPPKFMKSIPFLLISLSPLVVDGVTQTMLALRESTNELRLATGFLFGFGLVYFFSSRIVSYNMGKVDIRSQAVVTARISTALVLLILFFSYLIQDDYVTYKQAVELSGLDPSLVSYFSRRTLQTMSYDPYIGEYEDEILISLLRHGNRGYGVWAVYEGETVGYGRYLYAPGGQGKLKLIPDSNSI